METLTPALREHGLTASRHCATFTSIILYKGNSPLARPSSARNPPPRTSKRSSPAQGEVGGKLQPGMAPISDEAGRPLPRSPYYCSMGAARGAGHPRVDFPAFWEGA